MNLEEFRKKYSWAANMSANDVKELMLHFMMLQLKTSVEKSGDSLTAFFEDCKDVAMQ